MWGRDLLQGGLRWITCNGRSINFWTDHWLPPRPIRGLIHGPFLPHEYGYRVTDMITNNHQWDFTSLSIVLPSYITQFIYAQPLPLPDTPLLLLMTVFRTITRAIAQLNPHTITLCLSPMRQQGGCW